LTDPATIAPVNTNSGYCMMQVAQRPNLAISTFAVGSDGSMIVTDLGRLVNEALMPSYCDTTAGFAGGITTPNVMLPGDGYVYAVMRNNFSNATPLTSKANQGIIIARASISSFNGTSSDTQQWYFFDVTDKSQGANGSWTFSTQSTDATDFPTHVLPLNNITDAYPWHSNTLAAGPKGYFIAPQPHFNTQLGTYVMLTTNVAKSDTNTSLQPALWYFAGASLATDPLNWRPFDSWTDYLGAAQSVAANGGVSSPVYKYVLGGLTRDSNCDYYFQLVGPSANNPACLASMGGGAAGKETQLCIGARADFFSENFTPQPPSSCAGHATVTDHTFNARVQLVFARDDQKATCAGVLWGEAAGGSRGLLRGVGSR
jgi:hypothetical protein